MSASRMQPLLLLNAKMLQLSGWKSAEVITCRIAHANELSDCSALTYQFLAESFHIRDALLGTTT
jgi:hypothetical protein